MNKNKRKLFDELRMWQIIKHSFFSTCFLLLFVSCKEDGGVCLKDKGDHVALSVLSADFSKLKNKLEADIVLKNGSKSVVVNGREKSMEELASSFEVKDGQLVLKTQQCINFKSSPLVEITAPYLDHIIQDGSGIINGENTLYSSVLYYEVNGSVVSQMDIEVEDELELDIGGTSNMILTGSSPKNLIFLSGNATVNLYGVENEVSEVHIQGGGICLIAATDSLDVTISGSGTVYYKGNPVITQDISGSGAIIDDN